MFLCILLSFFFFNDTATTEIYTLSLHDALPICSGPQMECDPVARRAERPIEAEIQRGALCRRGAERLVRSEEHTSELQSHSDLVCRLLLEKKKKKNKKKNSNNNTMRQS